MKEAYSGALAHVGEQFFVDIVGLLVLSVELVREGQVVGDFAYLLATLISEVSERAAREMLPLVAFVLAAHTVQSPLEVQNG